MKYEKGKVRHVTDQRKDISEEFLVGIIVESNELDRMAILKRLSRILQKAGFSQYFRDDAKIGFTLVFCDYCGEPVDDFGDCIGCGRNNFGGVKENNVQMENAKKI